MNLNINKRKKQNKLYVTFRDNTAEEELYKFILKKSEVGGVSNYFKQLALKDMQGEKNG